MTAERVHFTPIDFTYRRRAEACLDDVVRQLGLTRRLARVHVRVLPDAVGDAARVAWVERPRLEVRLVTDLGNFLTPHGRFAVARLPAGAKPSGNRFSARAARALFRHELSHVADGVRFGIDSSGLSPARWGPFNEAWNVWIDGRLWRRGTPALHPAERWREFRATFPGARRRGLAGARSRAVFDRLWRADVLSQADLLDAVAALGA